MHFLELSVEFLEGVDRGSALALPAAEGLWPQGAVTGCLAVLPVLGYQGREARG